MISVSITTSEYERGGWKEMRENILEAAKEVCRA